MWPSWSSGVEEGRGALQRRARPCRGRGGKKLWHWVQICLTWIVLCQCLVWWTCAMCSVWNGSLHWENLLSTPQNSSLCMLDLWYLWKSVSIYWISLCALLRCFSQQGMWAHTDGWFLCDCQWSQYLVSVESHRAQGELSRPLVLYALASHCRQCTVHQQSWQCSWWCSCGARWTCHCREPLCNYWAHGLLFDDICTICTDLMETSSIFWGWQLLGVCQCQHW